MLTTSITVAFRSLNLPENSLWPDTPRADFSRENGCRQRPFSLFTISGTSSSGHVIGANSSLRVAVAGINGRGRGHIDGYAKLENVRVTCLVDPDSRLFKAQVAVELSEKYNTDPTCVQDIRRGAG